MICKNCSAEYDDNCCRCPDCGQENEEYAADAVINDEAFEQDEADTYAEDSVQEDCEALAEAEAEEQDEAQTEEVAEADTSAEAENETAEPEKAEEEAEEEAADGAQSSREDEAEKPLPVKKVRRQAPPRRPVADARGGKAAVRRRRVARPVIKAEKRTSTMIIAIMCVVAMLAAGTTALNITTDLFETDDTAEKMVASVGFTSGEQDALEQVLSMCFSAAKKEYDQGNTFTEDFILERINPADRGNVYSRLNNVSEKRLTKADPAERFADEEGNYSYYRLKESKVDKVLSLFGLESYRGENCEDYYYCDGYYYFAAKKASTTPVVKVEITKSRRVLDGSYYVECYFYAEKNGETVKTDTCYLVVEMTKDESSAEPSFVIKKISAKPIFGSDGKLLDADKVTQKKKVVIEGKTDKGKLYCVYTVEYPVLEGEGAGYSTVNEFFENAVSVYRLNAEAAQDSYKTFVKSGGDKSQLPFKETVVASVVYEDEENISFIGKISRLNPAEKKADAGQDEEEAPRLYERSVEAYTIDKVSGNFVSKDSVVGKDYMLLSELLYRICNGYEYDDLLPDEDSEDDYYTDYYYGEDEIPEDSEQQGMKIYESPWALSKQGVTFYYATQEGYVKEVTIPSAVLKKINA